MGFNILQVIKSTPNYVSPYKSLYVAHFQVDTESDLPAREQTDYIIDLGSTAHVVDTNSEYAIKSNGTWVLQYEGTAAYTKAEIDDMFEDVDDKFDDYQPLLTWDNVPTENSTNPVYSKGIYYPMLTYINETFIDIPTKNRLQNNGVSTTVANEVEFTVNPDYSVTATVIATTTGARSLSWYFTCPAGTWLYTTGQTASGAYPAICYSYLYDTSGIANDYSGNTFTMEEDKSIRCFIQIRSSTPAGTVLTFKPMICTKIEYEMSNKYIPYDNSGNRNMRSVQLNQSSFDDDPPEMVYSER